MGRKKVTILSAALVSFLAINMGIVASAKTSLEYLYNELSKANSTDAQNVEKEILRLWNISGSASIDFLYKLGGEALEAKDYNVAADHYSAVVEFAPEFAMGWYGRSRAYTLLGYHGPALKDLKKTLMINPMNFLAINSLGQILQKLGYLDTAYKAYERALEIHPNLEAALDYKKEIEAKLLDKKI